MADTASDVDAGHHLPAAHCLAHDWALVHFVPVEYNGSPGTRQSRTLVAAMV